MKMPAAGFFSPQNFERWTFEDRVEGTGTH